MGISWPTGRALTVMETGKNGDGLHFDHFEVQCIGKSAQQYASKLPLRWCIRLRISFKLFGSSDHRTQKIPPRP